MIHRLQSTPSTMRDAAALAAQGAPHGTAVVADRQTAGIGRHGHSWHSEPDAGLYLSLILRLPAATPALTMALGLAVQQAVNDLAQVSTDLRWPNDVMLNERKLAGIMVQSESGALIAGIGVNVNHSAFPDDLKQIATSLKLETGHAHDREALLTRVIAESLRYAALPKEEVLRRFEQRSSYVRGKSVIVDERLTGITAGLDPNGFLLLDTANGVETVIAGGVRPL
ncbi:MAG TPA: biotin--[acetyl-CoA-carboxylase] ligase [Bryobacteraceae bacterium]|nr:biotin--[acetyl-CoA-carboxylase] ligase [Bryobacteraceae bacterium]